jgi:excinuclease ABC subunit C
VIGVLEEMGVEDVPIVGISKGPIAMPGASISICPTGASRCCRPIRRCCSISSGCATRRTASRSARTARSARKAIGHQPLDDVPGIGPARKKALLMHFGTARAVRGAGLEDLQKAPHSR